MAVAKPSVASRGDKTYYVPKNRESTSSSFWIPNTDVYAVEDRLVVKVELAGIRREDLELTAEINRLIISGFRKDCCRESNAKCRFLVMEINYGAFESVIELPEGYDLNCAKAAYQNGFLRIDIPYRLTLPAPSKSIPISSD